ncbi:hypothetical protein [Yersinia phage PY54]|uniref:hypothetical protein n=1 Tax=Yersinia phage PY54 TaxID=172667 RepID=UPI00001B9846|nr:hypothetical protein PY54p25 [Yersinia phage PY54]CAD91786.1 hypothetical protein [Yersinia phage PY54]
MLSADAFALAANSSASSRNPLAAVLSPAAAVAEFPASSAPAKADCSLSAAAFLLLSLSLADWAELFELDAASAALLLAAEANCPTSL